MDESQVRLDDMRLMGALASSANFTAVGAQLGIPKQTVARRVAALESALGVKLIERSTRTFRLTALGRTYSERCAALARDADELNRSIRGSATEVAGVLRVTADPLFGEIFLPALLSRFARAYPSVRIEATLTSRYVDLVDEGYDVAFRVGGTPDPSLVAFRVADATMVYVASRAYLARRGSPKRPDDLSKHDCIALAPEGTPARWAFLREGELSWRPIQPRVRVNHLGLAREAALAGLGVANLPYFAAAPLIDSHRLELVLPRHAAAFGAIYVVHPSRGFITARTRAFRVMATEYLQSRRELQLRPAPSLSNRRASPGRSRSSVRGSRALSVSVEERT